METEGSRPDRELHDELEADADGLERQGREVEQGIEETRSEWERKKEDSTVPGAQPDDTQEPASGSSPDDQPGGPA
jgi:hypothetical protein